MRLLIAAVIPLLLTGCSRSAGPPPSSPLSPTVCIENAAAAVGAIKARAGTTTWHVQPGATECKRVSLSSPHLELRAESIGGGMRGRVRYRTRLSAMGEACWSWRLDDTVASQEDLLPCDHRRSGA